MDLQLCWECSSTCYAHPQSLNDCAITVKSQYSNDTGTGATTDWPSGNGHYAEFGQTSRNGNEFYTKAQFVDRVSCITPSAVSLHHFHAQ